MKEAVIAVFVALIIIGFVQDRDRGFPAKAPASAPTGTAARR